MKIQRRRPRQVPVSCQLCRSMKLRCNREQPCSNCLTRGVACERVPVMSSGAQLAQEQSSAPTQIHDNILARLTRLEAIVLRSHGADEGERASVAKTTPALAPLSHISEGEGDSKWLDGVGSREAPVISGLSNGISFSVISIRQGLTAIVSEYSLASWLLERYTEYIAYIHYVVHIPSSRLLLEDAYKQLSLGSSPEPGHVALLLSIFASTAYMLEAKAADSLFLNQANAVSCSIEDVQAAIILSFIIFNIEGFSSRFRTTSSSALIMARDLSLHRIDADTFRDNEDPVQIEIKRRIWWHMAATDWLLSLSGGPQQGTYLVHPKHMCVNRPRNIDDLDLERSDPEHTLPLSQPTAMTYYILRIKLAEISRSVVDALPFSPSDWAMVEYDMIVSLNRKFDEFLRDLPVFFRHDAASREQSRNVDRRYPQTIFQRYIIASTFHSSRIKLNQPFLTRISLDPGYEYSRKVCLESARSIINMHNSVQQDAGLLASVHVRLATFLCIFFLATAVLVIDLCINKDEDNEGRRQEVMEACYVLKQAEESSSIAGRFLKSLIDILHKYQIRVSPEITPRPTPTGSNSNADPTDICTAAPSTTDGNVLWPNSLEEGISDIDGMWQSFIELGNSGDVTSWDDIFSALGTRTL
ncbi:Zn(II)2Cys6 transcription factor [Aspergillus alliaceus]|uniref:Zn(II)2Cys6 transcription factor n=1 Tax=Petromyces alliaceus TaxID=209559 RepID=UPI0012A65252|nr:uncharacterized protein BDW43DRAFT_295792 [Aspergillus alliaceus]KAB8239309.1 hypothetical protein BDW43DRAFT_295792 [Aspergillus alliaceus]